MKIYASQSNFDFSTIQKFVGTDCWVGVINKKFPDSSLSYINFAALSADSVTYSGVSNQMLVSTDIEMTQGYYDNLRNMILGYRRYTVPRSKFLSDCEVLYPIDIYTTDELLDILNHNATIIDYTPAMYSGDIDE